MLDVSPECVTCGYTPLKTSELWLGVVSGSLVILKIIVASEGLAVSLVVIGVARNARDVGLWRVGVVFGMITAGGVLRGLGGLCPALARLGWFALYIRNNLCLVSQTWIQLVSQMWVYLEKRPKPSCLIGAKLAEALESKQTVD